MKNCTKCGAQNPDEAQFCYNCGEPFVKTKKIEVHGIKTWYVNHLPVRIFIDDVFKGEVKHGEVKVIEIKCIDCTMTLTWLSRKLDLLIPAEFDGKVKINTNGLTARLSAVLEN